MFHFFLIIAGMFECQLMLAYGDAVSDAYDQQVKAYHNYSREMNRLGPNATEHQKKEARNRILAPAKMKVSGALIEKVKAAESSVQQKLKQVEKDFQEDTSKASVGTDRTEDSSKKNQAKKRVFEEVAPEPREETVLDGSGIEREVNFGRGGGASDQSVDGGTYHKIPVQYYEDDDKEIHFKKVPRPSPVPRKGN